MKKLLKSLGIAPAKKEEKGEVRWLQIKMQPGKIITDLGREVRIEYCRESRTNCIYRGKEELRRDAAPIGFTVDEFMDYIEFWDSIYQKMK